MKREKVQEYTLRITESNRSGLVVVMYDMIMTYLEDAKTALAADHNEDFKENIRNADRVLRELQEILDFKYEISGNLYSLYMWCRKSLAASMMKHSPEGIDEAVKVLSRLGESFREVTKTDSSEPLMKNTQQVYAGMTYGKNDLTENRNDYLEASRGFFV